MSTLTVRSRILLDLGRTAEALASAEMSVAMLEDAKPKAAFRADAHFTLARALAAEGRDPERAHDLARRAAAIWKNGKSAQDQQNHAEVMAWLEARG